MAVNGANVVEAKVFKQRGGHHHAFGMGLEPLGQLQQWRRHAEHVLADVSGRCIKAPAHQLRQIAVERTDRRADAHVVVVQHHQQLAVIMHAGVIQRLKGHAGAHGTVANDGYRVAVFALLPGSQCHAKCGRNRG